MICQFALNLKMSITAVTGVSFETLKDYMLQNLKMMPLTIKTPTLPQMTRLFSIFVHIQSLFLLLFSHFSKIEPLKSYGKCFFFSPKQLIWFLQYSNFRRKLGIEKQITTIYWYGMLKLPTLIFRKNQKPLQIKKKQLNKPSEHIWRYLKSGSWHF